MHVELCKVSGIFGLQIRVVRYDYINYYYWPSYKVYGDLNDPKFDNKVAVTLYADTECICM